MEERRGHSVSTRHRPRVHGVVIRVALVRTRERRVFVRVLVFDDERKGWLLSSDNRNPGPGNFGPS